MFYKNKKFCAVTLSLMLSLCIGFSGAAFAKDAKKAETCPVPVVQTEAQNVTFAKPLQIVQNPSKFLNQDIKMNATFDKFSTLGLDYKKVLRESKDYIGFLIQRDDVSDHNIPLSEMKLFLKREYAEKFIDLDTGDRIEITGRVFSNALGDAWIDVNNITVLKKAKAEETTKK